MQMGAEDAGFASAFSTTAPAPSPNSTQVVRSFQSTMRVSVSVPITSRACIAAADELVGHASAYMKPNRPR
jgi:hypothetical protein